MRNTAQTFKECKINRETEMQKQTARNEHDSQDSVVEFDVLEFGEEHAS
jgi:hypothetical protein